MEATGDKGGTFHEDPRSGRGDGWQGLQLVRCVVAVGGPVAAAPPSLLASDGCAGNGS